jgi:hypothetical protein
MRFWLSFWEYCLTDSESASAAARKDPVKIRVLTRLPQQIASAVVKKWQI